MHYFRSLINNCKYIFIAMLIVLFIIKKLLYCKIEAFSPLLSFDPSEFVCNSLTCLKKHLWLNVWVSGVLGWGAINWPLPVLPSHHSVLQSSPGFVWSCHNSLWFVSHSSMSMLILHSALRVHRLLFLFSKYRSARCHGDPWGKNPCGGEMEPTVGS